MPTQNTGAETPNRDNQGELKNIVLFQYHDDDGVGKDGELFADIKARKAQA